MSIETTMTPRREFMDLPESVPDGAEVTFKRKRVNPDTGEAHDVTAKWVHSTGQESGARPMMTLPGDIKPVPAEQQMPVPRRAMSSDPRYTFESDTASDADRMGISRSASSQSKTPVNLADTRRFLETKMQDLSISPDRRRAAAGRLSIMDENDTRASAQASAERREAMNAAGVAAKAQADRDARVEAAGVTGQSRVEAAGVTGQSRVEAAGVTADQKAKELEAKQQMARERNASYLEARRMMVDARKQQDPEKLLQTLNRMETHNFGSAFGEPQSIGSYIESTYDKETGQLRENAEPDLSKEAHLDAINELRARLGKPPLFQRAEERNQQSTKGKEADANGDDMVRIRAPNGSIRSVPRASAKKYMDKGGVIVQ